MSAGPRDLLSIDKQARTRSNAPDSRAIGQRNDAKIRMNAHDVASRIGVGAGRRIVRQQSTSVACVGEADQPRCAGSMFAQRTQFEAGATQHGDQRQQDVDFGFVKLI